MRRHLHGRPRRRRIMLDEPHRRPRLARTPRPCGGAPRELPRRHARSTPGASRSSPRRSPVPRRPCH
eukprot:5763368-Alexandrium_andersonii.AAC.1